MIHLNGHVLCAVDCETTGLQPRFHDIVQVCVLPLDSNLKPLESVSPFYTEMQPKRPDNIDLKGMTVNNLQLSKIMQTAWDAERAADFFREWFEDLKLPEKKMLVPLAHNWIFDHAFMEDWLGYHEMNAIFHGHYRDLMAAGLYENDKADFHVEQYPYPKLGLKYFCSQLGVQNHGAHDAYADCVATAECYRRVVLKGMFTQVIAPANHGDLPVVPDEQDAHSHLGVV